MQHCAGVEWLHLNECCSRPFLRDNLDIAPRTARDDVDPCVDILA